MKERKKIEQPDTSVVATPAFLNAPMLAVFEISRWSLHCYSSTSATLLYVRVSGLIWEYFCNFLTLFYCKCSGLNFCSGFLLIAKGNGPT
jgi:hypothetical protein